MVLLLEVKIKIQVQNFNYPQRDLQAELESKCWISLKDTWDTSFPFSNELCLSKENGKYIVELILMSLG